MTIVIINSMSIVYVQMFVIDVCFLACVRVLSLLIGLCMYGGMVYVLQNL